MTRTAFVTGAAGFVGRHLVDALLDQGWQVIAFCRPVDRSALLAAEVRVEIGDLTDIATIRAAMPEGIDTVFHLAGNTSTWKRNAAQQRRDNVDGTRNVVEVAIERHVRRLVDTSSISAYGWQPGVVLREDSASNVQTKGDDYGKTKREAEEIIRAAVRDRGLSAVILNPVNVVGAYDAANWSRQLILPISRGGLKVVPPGSATWMSVHDLVAAEIAAADSGCTGNIVLGGTRASFLEVITTIERIFGRPVSKRATPRLALGVAFVATEAIAAVTRKEPELSLAKYRRATGDLQVDDALAVRELGLGRTTLHEMLEETIDWLREVDMLPARGPTVPRAEAVDGIPVTEEEHHGERFRMPGARIYEAVIAPGTRTRYHRHDRETLYVVLRDGRFRSVQPPGQRTATRLGRSVGLPRTVWWLIQRALSGGWLQMPAGTVLMQHHLRAPLTHLVENGGPIELHMLGVELDGMVAPPPAPAGLRAEYSDSSVLVLRVRGTELTTVPAMFGVAIVVTGSAEVGGATLQAGEYAATTDPRSIRCIDSAEVLLVYP